MYCIHKNNNYLFIEKFTFNKSCISAPRTTPLVTQSIDIYIEMVSLYSAIIIPSHVL